MGSRSHSAPRQYFRKFQNGGPGTGGGPAGLCLEYGPDNWQSELTGADMLVSAERLLSAEAITGPAGEAAVPSRHATTPGQDVRGRFSRFVVTQSLQSMLTAAQRRRTARAQFVTIHHKSTYVIVPRTVTGFSTEPWTDPEVPEALSPPAVIWNGLAFTLPTGVELPSLSERSALWSFLGGVGFEPPADYEPAAIEFVVVYGDAGPRLFWLHPAENSLFEPAVVVARGGQRLDADHLALQTKTVGIVGCGSAGSKIATMLARSGVGAVVPVDDDIFLPENLVRHALDWTSIGGHKAEALARRLALVAPGVRCTVRTRQLGGQESNSGADWSLTVLSECDVVVDATANPQAFNILAGLVQAAGKPLVWLEVFAGGIGGLVARSRPVLDPGPQRVRAHIEAWCAEHGAVAPRPAMGYGLHEREAPLIADDADVTVMAAHAARVALDLLMGRDPSRFPASAYLVGLAPAWKFSQPFETFPIDVGTGEPVTGSTSVATPEDLETIAEMISERRDQPGHPSGSDR